MDLSFRLKKMAFANINGFDLYYEIHGKGDPVILLHHGFGCTRMWEDIFPALIEYGYQVVLYDRKGYGRSQRISHARTRMAGKIERLARCRLYRSLLQPVYQIRRRIRHGCLRPASCAAIGGLPVSHLVSRPQLHLQRRTGGDVLPPPVSRRAVRAAQLRPQHLRIFPPGIHPPGAQFLSKARILSREKTVEIILEKVEKSKSRNIRSLMPHHKLRPLIGAPHSHHFLRTRYVL